MDDGTRTHDDRDHNPGLYQLSYAHHWFFCLNLNSAFVASLKINFQSHFRLIGNGGKIWRARQDSNLQPPD